MARVVLCPQEERTSVICVPCIMQTSDMVDEFVKLVKKEYETRKALAKHVEKIHTILQKSKANPASNLEATNNVCGVY